MRKVFAFIFFYTLPVISLSFLTPNAVKAQVTRDGTTSTTVNKEGDDFTIEKGKTSNNNLFHSFDEFSVPMNGSAKFNNAESIVNIFSRVTGGNISNINGLIEANGSANLFLLNPNGIVFGENASLNLGGSFLATTADSISFDENQEFSASNPQAAELLDVNIPIGFSFRDNPGDIKGLAVDSDGSLTARSGNSITLLGGNIMLENLDLIARGLDIELGGLLEAGTIGIDENGGLNFPGDITRGDIILKKSQIIVSTFAEGDAGNITIKAEDSYVELDESQIFSNVETGGVGNAGTVDIEAKSLSLINGGQIQTLVRSTGKGNAGNIKIVVDEALNISGENESKNLSSLITSDVRESGGLDSNFTSGDIRIKAGSLSITSNKNQEPKSQISSRIFAQGNGGDINIEVNQGSVNLKKALISTRTSDKGDAGDITIKAGDSEVVLDETQIISNVEQGGVGDAGNLGIEAKSLSLINGGQIQTLVSQGNEDLDPGVGNAGDIEIVVDGALNITGENTPGKNETKLHSLITSEVQLGDSESSRTENDFFSGNIYIEAGSLSITSNKNQEIKSQIDTSSRRQDGNSIAGDIAIKITQGSIFLDRADISATSQSSINEGANVNLTVAEDIILRNNSLISAEAFAEAGGGDVAIDANDGVIIAFPDQNSDIVANGLRGKGGNIDISTRSIFGLVERRSIPENQTNDLDADSRFDVDGNIEINTPDVDPTSGLIELPQVVGDASDQISQNPCEQGVGSEFFDTGKGGLPPNPNEPLSSHRETEVELIKPVSSAENNIVEVDRNKPESKAFPAKGWKFNDRGQVILTSYSTENSQTNKPSRQINLSICSDN